MPASITASRAPRSRTWRTRATIQPARATRTRPGSTARRRGRRSAGTVSRSAGISRANRPGAGTLGAHPNGATGKPPPTSSVSKSGMLPRTRPSTATALRTPSRQASMAPSCDPTWRWMPRGRRPPGAAPARRCTVRVSSVSVMPNFDAPEPTARTAWVSGATSGFRRKRTSSVTCAPWANVARASASSGDSTAIQRSGSPRRAADTAARRSASVLPTPSSVIDSFGSPARRARAHSPRETTFAPSPSLASSAMIAGTSFALMLNCRIQGSGKAASNSRAAAARPATSVT